VLVALSAALLLAISVAAYRVRRRCPFVTVGWLWYLVTLLPVIGLVQVGQQALADRYTYVPLIGIFVALVWGSAQLFDAAIARGLQRRAGIATLATLLLALTLTSIGITRAQLGHWRDSVTLFERALAVEERNPVAHNELALAHVRGGRVEHALPHYLRAIELWPDYAEAHNNLGGALAQRGELAPAVAAHRRALALAPQYPEAANNLGVALARQGRFDEAIESLERALELRPAYGKAHANLAAVLLENGDVAAARQRVDLARATGFEPPPELLRRLAASRDDGR